MPMTEDPAEMRAAPRLKWRWTVLLALWIFGVSFFYLVRVSFLIYGDQQSSLDRLLHWFQR